MPTILLAELRGDLVGFASVKRASHLAFHLALGVRPLAVDLELELGRERSTVRP